MFKTAKNINKKKFKEDEDRKKAYMKIYNDKQLEWS